MECIINTEKEIYLREGYVFCYTICNRVLKVRLFNKKTIHPEVFIKYMKYLSMRIDPKYVLEQHMAYINKESKMVLERIVGSRVCSTGILTEDLKAFPFLRVSFGKSSLNELPPALPLSFLLLHPSAETEASPALLQNHDSVEVIERVLLQERLLEKIKDQQKTYNKYGRETIHTLQRRFFGCYALKKKRMGIKPFTLKGEWTKEKAQKFLYSYKTYLALCRSSFFINFLPYPDNSHGAVEMNGTMYYYRIKISKIKLIRRKEIEENIRFKEFFPLHPKNGEFR
ncbi:hypothetical protein NEFER03_0149 [Nematocida sp. LUAm3]|nr:hypothetical protein NEFER03_0149 [Nematocida sp. LUAm3]KAI5173602.1 hypothetical protein NEFER02_0118 [Nematocida sp. LUAm2]KAI5176823.1 hypothetical protein NEFER01_0148 [Nematocida sp. LUAm1]